MPRRRRRRSGHSSRRWLRRTVIGLVVVATLFGGVIAAWIASDHMPRQWARYLDRRAAGNGDFIQGATRAVTQRLVAADRGELAPLLALPDWTRVVGADVQRDVPKPVGRERVVNGLLDLRAAVESAQPGDIITIFPGRYELDDRAIRLTRPGTPEKPIRIRAPSLGAVTITSKLPEVFVVAASYWVIEQLNVRGGCDNDDRCEHAIHVVGAGSNVLIRNNLFEDFNAHIKINGESGRYPDFGRIEYNTLRNARARQTANPVTPIDLVAASRWQIRFNLITDFVRTRGDTVSYGVFAKGAGIGVLFDSNVIVCEQRLVGAPGIRVGLSFGGGGSSSDGCRDKRCVVEHEQGVAVNNVIARCSDAGVSIMRSSQTRLEHNTIIDTAGIEVRGGESSVVSLANLVDGPIRSRSNGSLTAAEDYHSWVLGAFVGRHRVRALYADAMVLDLNSRAPIPTRPTVGTETNDLCGQPRPARPRFGAIEDVAACKL